MPKVSIVIPVYNVEKYLRECLDSVIKPTLQDIEIICVNDGSTDNSLQILKEYSLKGILPTRDLYISINCIPVDCKSLDKCRCNN